MHIISGSSDAEQRREGDYLDKSERYARSDEYIQILRKIWAADGPVSHDGTYYRFADFQTDVKPFRSAIPISVGGSSEDVYRVGGQQGDIFGLWGEPLKETADQIASVNRYADADGRPRPRIWVSFRPIVAATDGLAWEKAHATLAQVQRNSAAGKTTQALRPDAARYGIYRGRPPDDGRPLLRFIDRITTDGSSGRLALVLAMAIAVGRRRSGEERTRKRLSRRGGKGGKLAIDVDHPANPGDRERAPGATAMPTRHSQIDDSEGASQ